ncbi:hypothetical protein [Streptomyces roseolus]|uniref:hypothetical protein n=1 Tax=Streptomyces roseolus TaxID=67358 RepID=UPI0037B44A19
MLRRHWIRKHQADGRLLGAGTDSTGPTHFHLSHLEVRTAKRCHQLQLTRTHTIGTIAAYQPARAKRYQDIVAVQSRPDPDGNVKVLSGQFRKLITVALTDLRPAPPAALAPGKLTDSWAVMDEHDTWLLIVKGTTYSAARREACRAVARPAGAKSQSLRALSTYSTAACAAVRFRPPSPSCTPLSSEEPSRPSSPQLAARRSTQLSPDHRREQLRS